MVLTILLICVDVDMFSVQPAASCRRRAPTALLDNINLIPVILRIYNTNFRIFRYKTDRVIVRIRLWSKIDVRVRYSSAGRLKRIVNLSEDPTAAHIGCRSIQYGRKQNKENSNGEQPP